MRLILFVDLEQPSSRMLLAASLEAAAARDDVEIAAIFDTWSQPPIRLPMPGALAGHTMRGALNVANAAELRFPMLPATVAAALRQMTRVSGTGNGNGNDPRRGTVNDPAFVELVRGLEPDATLALMVGQLYRPPLLEACKVSINYHPGLLPQYQGVGATGWSIYDEAPESGFTFHRMTSEIDRGPILLQDAVPVHPWATAARVEHAKTQLASSRLNGLFDMLVSNAADPVQPTDPGSYHNRSHLRAIRTVDEPESLSLGELQRRLRAFESLDMRLADRRWNVTELRLVGRRPRDRELSFLTADGAWIELSRVYNLPMRVYRPLRSFLSMARSAT